MENEKEKDTANTDDILCRHFKPGKYGKRCLFYLDNGVCFRPGVHLCSEWLRINRDSSRIIKLQDDMLKIRLGRFFEEVVTRIPVSIAGIRREQSNPSKTAAVDPFELPESPQEAPQGDLRRSKLNLAINTHGLAKAKQGPPVAPTNDHSFKLDYSPKPIATGVNGINNVSFPQYLGRENSVRNKAASNCPETHRIGPYKAGSTGTNFPQDIVQPASKRFSGFDSKPNSIDELPPSAAGSITQAEIDSFKALEAEVCIDAPSGEIWIVPRYSQADRIEFIPEDLEFLFATRRTFPDSTISKVERIQPLTKETAHAK